MMFGRTTNVRFKQLCLARWSWPEEPGPRVATIHWVMLPRQELPDRPCLFRTPAHSMGDILTRCDLIDWFNRKVRGLACLSCRRWRAAWSWSWTWCRGLPSWAPSPPHQPDQIIKIRSQSINLYWLQQFDGIPVDLSPLAGDFRMMDSTTQLISFPFTVFILTRKVQYANWDQSINNLTNGFVTLDYDELIHQSIIHTDLMEGQPTALNSLTCKLPHVAQNWTCWTQSSINKSSPTNLMEGQPVVELEQVSPPRPASWPLLRCTWCSHS